MNKNRRVYIASFDIRKSKCQSNKETSEIPYKSRLSFTANNNAAIMEVIIITLFEVNLITAFRYNNSCPNPGNTTPLKKKAILEKVSCARTNEVLIKMIFCCGNNMPSRAKQCKSMYTSKIQRFSCLIRTLLH